MHLTQAITTRLPQPITSPLAPPTAAPIPTFTPGTGASDTWTTYRNDRSGYTVEYPAAWKINERLDPGGAEVTTFSPDPANAGIGITVIVRNGASADQEVPDMPNTRCQRVTIGKLTGQCCFDTLAFSVSTTFLDQGKQYTIAASGKHLDQNIYQRFLESFAVTA